MVGPSLDHLRTFVTVFRSGSVTAAARLLGVSQATVSTHVQALETSLGYALFERGPGGVSPTPRGTELARQVAGHVDALEDATMPSWLDARARRAVHVGGPAEILSTLVLPHLQEVIAAVDAPIRLVFGLADDLLNALVDGSLDLVVSAVPPRRKGVGAVPFYDEEFVLVAAPAWAGTEDVDSIPVVGYAEDLPIIRRYWRTVFDRPPTGVRIGAVVPDLRGIRTVVLAGVGMSVLPAYLIADDLEHGDLIALRSPEVPPLNTLYLAARGRDLEHSAPVAVVAAHLRRLIR